MYAFFQKHLNNPGDSTDQAVDILSNEEIRVTKTGQAATSLNSETIFSQNSKQGKLLEKNLEQAREHPETHLPSVVQAAKELSGYQAPEGSLEPVFVGRFQKQGYAVEQYFIQGEGDYVIPYLVFKPEHPGKKALLYLHSEGKSAEASPGQEIEWFVKQGITVLAPDVLGTGEIGQGSGQSPRTYLLNWFASTLISRSIVGVQAGDAARLVNVLKADASIDEVYGLAHNEQTTVLLHAAALNTDITRVALVDPLASYRSIVENRFYHPRFIHSFVPGALQAYDLPDLAASLAPRKLAVVGMVDGAGNANVENVTRDQQVIQAGYQARKAEDRLTIVPKQTDEQLLRAYEAWIN